MKMKKKLLLGTVLFSLSSFVLPESALLNSSITAEAAVIGDDYPAKWKNAPMDSIVDSWGMYNRECTSFVAYRLSSTNKFTIQRAGMDWNANKWGTNARAQGYKVDKNPAIGSVAWWSAGFHVAWVAEISGNQVKIEEYNNPAGSGRYNSRWINKDSVDGYIHFKDLGNPTPKPPTTPDTKLKVYKIDDVQNVNGILQIRSNELVPVSFNWIQNGIAAADVKLTDSTGKLLTDQKNVTKGKSFVFDPSRVKSVPQPLKGDGGYYWSNVNLTSSGPIWLSVWNKNHLLYGKQ